MPTHSYFLIRFRPSPVADTEIAGCLRFPLGTNWAERDEGLRRWRQKHRGCSELGEGEAMWLEGIGVEVASF